MGSNPNSNTYCLCGFDQVINLSVAYFSSVNEDNMVVVNAVSRYLQIFSSEHLVELYFLSSPWCWVWSCVLLCSLECGVETIKSACNFHDLYFPCNHNVQDRESPSSCNLSLLMWVDTSEAPFQVIEILKMFVITVNPNLCWVVEKLIVLSL